MYFTIEEALELALVARKACYKDKSQRFGQTLWNLLPNEVCSQHVGSYQDFFHERDAEKAERIFFDFYVKTEEV